MRSRHKESEPLKLRALFFRIFFKLSPRRHSAIRVDLLPCMHACGSRNAGDGSRGRFYCCCSRRPQMPLQDEGREAYVSEIAGRFVIPVTPTYKRTVGIVHDSSRTGKTLYVEPTQVRPRPAMNALPAFNVLFFKLFHGVSGFFLVRERMPPPRRFLETMLGLRVRWDVPPPTASCSRNVRVHLS